MWCYRGETKVDLLSDRGPRVVKRLIMCHRARCSNRRTTNSAPAVVAGAGIVNGVPSGRAIVSTSSSANIRNRPPCGPGSLVDSRA